MDVLCAQDHPKLCQTPLEITEAVNSSVSALQESIIMPLLLFDLDSVFMEEKSSSQRHKDIETEWF